jgi:hypothetical protein
MSNSHTYANEWCIYCEEPVSGEKIKIYKGLDCDQPWNVWPTCISHSHRKKWVMTRKHLEANGWVFKWGRGFCRSNANDWQTKEL